MCGGGGGLPSVLEPVTLFEIRFDPVADIQFDMVEGEECPRVLPAGVVMFLLLSLWRMLSSAQTQIEAFPSKCSSAFVISRC